MNPIVKNSKHPLKGDFLYAIERVLKLSVPNLYVWLCMFYCFFHLWYASLLHWYHNMSMNSLIFIPLLCYSLSHDQEQEWEKTDMLCFISCSRICLFKPVCIVILHV